MTDTATDTATGTGTDTETRDISFDLEGIDWPHLAEVFERAPLGARDPADLERAFRNSYLVCFARHGGRVVGTARVNSDGVYYATIVDVVVDPDCQGHGIGRAMMEALLARLPMRKIFLTSVKGKEGFYRKFGFLAQTNAMALYAEPLREQALASGVLREG